MRAHTEGILKVLCATALYAVVHSVFASRGAKRIASRLTSERTSNALYRPFYLAQSFVTMALLIRYIREQPNTEIYRLRGPAALGCRLLQAGGIGWATYSAYEVGLTEILGARGLFELLSRQPLIEPPPEAQGPALSPDGNLRVAGPFRLSRHPLNFAPLVILWSNPRMTANLLAYNLLSTAYLLAGSWHEAVRLRAAYGGVYDRYTKSGVPFYFPRLQ
jgi:hypothetical protein